MGGLANMMLHTYSGWWSTRCCGPSPGCVGNIVRWFMIRTAYLQKFCLTTRAGLLFEESDINLLMQQIVVMSLLEMVLEL